MNGSDHSCLIKETAKLGEKVDFSQRSLLARLRFPVLLSNEKPEQRLSMLRGSKELADVKQAEQGAYS